MKSETLYTAFAGNELVVTGRLKETLRKTKAVLNRRPEQPILIFDNDTGEQVDFNFEGTLDEVLSRAIPPENKKHRGRPKLGVVGREISLLPRHWEWLDSQPLSASAVIRRLVDAARKSGSLNLYPRRKVEAAGKFIWAIAGNCENFEEASRALYASDWDRLKTLTRSWPRDIRTHLLWMVKRVSEFKAS